MGKIIYVLVVMVAWLLLAGVCLGKQVYLRDGAVIECESFWRRGDQVIVKVNRDIILEFDSNEVDSRKTFRAAKKKADSRQKRKSPAGTKKDKGAMETSAEQSQSGEGQQRPMPAQIPAAKPAPVAASVSAPAAPPAEKPAAQVAAPAPVTPDAASREAVQPAVVDPAAPPDKAELERRSREAAEMMAEALKKQDPELMKKAIEAQKSVIEAQKGGMPSEGQGSSPAQQLEFGAIGIKFMLIFLVSLLLMVVSTWVVFQKAGQPGWHSIIPIYNMYVMMEIAGKPWWWMFLLFVPVVGLIVYLLAMLSLAKKFGRGVVYGLGLFILPMFFFPMLAFGGASYEQ